MEKKYSHCKNIDSHLCPEAKTKIMKRVNRNMNTPNSSRESQELLSDERFNEIFNDPKANKLCSTCEKFQQRKGN